MSFWSSFRETLVDESASALAEYALITSVLTIICVVLIQLIGTIGVSEETTATNNFSNTGVNPP